MMMVLLLLVLSFIWWGIPVLIAKLRNNNLLAVVFVVVLFWSMDFSMGFFSAGRYSMPLVLLLAGWGFAMYMAFSKRDFSSKFQKQAPASAQKTAPPSSSENS